MPAILGVNVAAITPRREGPELDLAAAFDLIDFYSHSGVNGIALLGSTGEFLHFTLEERARFLSLGVKRSRVAIVAGVSHSTLDGALYLGREAADAGADALLLMPPYFFRYSQEDVREFYLAFAKQLDGAAPILLYNVPCFTTAIALDTAIDLLRTGLFAGIKDSSGDWDYFCRLQALREDGIRFRLLVGNDAVFVRLRNAGADGVVSGIASAVPELMLALDHAILTANQPETARLEARLQEFIARAERFPAPLAIREAAELRGLKPGLPAIPPGADARRRLAEFREWFKGWLPHILEECRHGR